MLAVRCFRQPVANGVPPGKATSFCSHRGLVIAGLPVPQPGSLRGLAWSVMALPEHVETGSRQGPGACPVEAPVSGWAP